MKTRITFPIHQYFASKKTATPQPLHMPPRPPRPALTDRGPRQFAGVCVWIKATVAPVRSSGV